MAKTSMKLKAQRAPKFKVQQHNRWIARRRKEYADYRCNCRYADKNP